MNVAELKKTDRIIYEVIAGSHAYNLNNEQSDIDLRGIFFHPANDHLSLVAPVQQVSDNTNDTTYYSLKRFFELIQNANPNLIELIWMPDSCVKVKKDAMDLLIANRDLFISKKCYHTHSGYAYAQIKKAKGSNKKVHNPQPKERPKKEDFCWVIDDAQYISTCKMSFRPKPLSEAGIDLSEFHVSSLEHSHNMYRLYHYGKEAKGVFRGDDMLVACESIPKEDEMSKIYGLLIYNKDGYEKTIKEWHSYWDWMKHRNSSRWVDQENKKLDYDQKNMMHCLRLLISGEHILRHGYPLVRFEGEQRDYLMSIRNGERDYDELMKEVDRRMAVLEDLYKTSKIPNSVDVPKINKLYMELVELLNS